MKNLALMILLNFLILNFCLAQTGKNGDFVEFGIRTSQFIESSFLENSPYQSQLSDPNTTVYGFMPSPTGKNYSAKLRYGKNIAANTHLIAELGYAQLEEQVICFCHVCDKIAYPTTLVTLNAIDAGIGVRYQLFEFKKINLSLEAIGNYSLLTNEENVKYFGYSIRPLVQYQWNEKLKVNLKYGYEQSFKGYEKKELCAELAVNYTIKSPSR